MKSLDDLEVAGRTVLVRADFNVPLADGPDGPDDTKVITDDGRIRAALPTITYLRDKGAKVVLIAHMGRAKGERVEGLTLQPVADRLSELNFEFALGNAGTYDPSFERLSLKTA